MQPFPLLSFLQQLRVKNLLFLALCMVVSALKHLHTTNNTPFFELLSLKGLWVLGGGTVALAAAGYIVNDLYDTQTDLNNPHKAQVAGRELSHTFLWKTYTLLTSSVVLLSLLISLKLTLYFTCIAFLLWAYSAWLKGKPLVGNILVAVLCGLVFWQFTLWRTSSAWFFWGGIVAFFATLCRELIKDAEDMQADAIAGIQSTAVAWGIVHTRTLATFFASILSFILGGIAFYTHSTSALHAVLYIGLGVGSIALAWKSIRAQSPEHFKTLSALWKLYMLVGLGVMSYS